MQKFKAVNSAKMYTLRVDNLPRWRNARDILMANGARVLIWVKKVYLH